MARNPKFALSIAQSERAAWARKELSPFVKEGSRVDVVFTKRDGSNRILTGTAVEIAGDDSAEHVKVVTDEGVRSANLWSVKMIS